MEPNKIWNKDITSMTQEDIQLAISNLFYQIFLVDIDALNYTIKTNEDGCRVKFILEGLAYKEMSLDSEDDI